MGRKREALNEEDNYCKAFPSHLRELLKGSKTTQATLAENLGISRQAVAAYCSGESTPSWEGIAKIARFFSCSSDYLLGLSDYRSRETEETTAAALGLSEQTIENLRNEQNDHGGFATMGLNLLLEQPAAQILFYHLYLFSDLAKAVKNSIEQGRYGETFPGPVQMKDTGEYLITGMEYCDLLMDRLCRELRDVVETATETQEMEEKIRAQREQHKGEWKRF